MLRNKIEILKTLIEKGSNLNFQNSKGKSCLHLQADNQNIYFLFTKILIENKADVNLQDKSKKTPFHYLAENEKISFPLVSFI